MLDNKVLLEKIAIIIVLIGGIAWGSIGFFQKDLIGDTLGQNVAVWIYDLVGVISLVFLLKMAFSFGVDIAPKVMSALKR